ncbi:peripheral-type benzodiazepine receptor-associated protein 1 [Elysia marginata]|uniref:Peripheral-type benzodiazepine receptor-associated protein 1 n=1 Tax=Elysia marginata TaxID=1093978 RepID=A0AAV4HQE8_9GAST|nr:peripheral-type benzodiazepine receptor-associated protein 1 [Elysia marginata]
MGACFSKQKSAHQGRTRDGSGPKTPLVPDPAYNRIPEVTEECNALKLSLASAQKEREAAQQEVTQLNIRVHSLENLVRDLQESAERTSVLDNERRTILSQLQERQAQIEQLQKTVSALTLQVQELEERRKREEDRRREEEERREDLAREVERLRKEAEERQKVVEEAEKLKEELAAKKLEAATALAVAKTQSALTASVKTQGHWSQEHLQPPKPKPRTKFYKNSSPKQQPEDPLLSNLGSQLNFLRERISSLTSSEEWFMSPWPVTGLDIGNQSDPSCVCLTCTGQPSLNQNDRVPGSESLLTSWARKGPIQVYIAKYNYDPFTLSPNENPEMELPLTAGDYVLVVGDMDEDGFYEGELIDGRQGLVPSNFIEIVEEEDLVEFHTALMQAGHAEYGNTSNISNLSIASNNNSFNNISNNNNDVGFHTSQNRAAKSEINNGEMLEEHEDSSSDLEDIAELDEDNASVNSRILTNGGPSSNSRKYTYMQSSSSPTSFIIIIIIIIIINIITIIIPPNHLAIPPCPRGLSLDRALTSSLLMSWSPPEPQPDLEVQAYHVMVDGQLNTSVKVTERTKALLEGVGLDKNHRVCVRCLSNRGQSKDAQCTMLVGKDVYPTPTELKVGHVTATSALLSWLPGNSNYQHSITVNGREVRVVKPGIFRHTLTGLAPGTAHKVTLMAKSISGALNEEKSRKYVENVSASIDFTTPIAGAPDPPLNVQVESGPRQGTLLVSWLPVTLSSSGVSNGATVAGYHVIADGTIVKVVTGPTTDHVVLSAIDLKGPVPSRLWVRTVSGSSVESGNSEQVVLPRALAKELGAGQVSTRTGPEEGHRGADTDEEIEAAFREAQHTNGIDAAMADHFSDSSSSELSDIPEVEEDLIGSTDSHLNEVGRRPSNHTPEFSQVTTSASPKPAPRKSMGSRGKDPEPSDSGPREFHAQKPTASEGSSLLATPSRMVPAIEITRDSSTERATSQEESTEENQASSSSPSRRNTPTSGAKSRPPPGDPSAQNAPSAFRHVGDQSNRPSQQGDPNREKTAVPSSAESPSHHRSRHDSPSSYGSPSHRHQGKPSDTVGSASSHSPAHYHNHHPHKHAQPTGDDRDHEAASEADVGGDSDSISGELNHPGEGDVAATDHHHAPVDANSIRLFIALFDYDPMTMSPNIDCVDEELPFREGQIIRVLGDKDSDGFYKGELAGRAGLVPCNMVSEVRIDDPELVEQLLQETQGTGGTQVHPGNEKCLSCFSFQLRTDYHDCLI